MPEQLKLKIPEPPQWGVVVDDVLLNAIGCPARDWWAHFAARFAQSGRERILQICIAGTVAEYGPFSEDDVTFIRDHMVEKGLHPKALKLRKWMTELPDCTGKGRCVRCARTHKISIPVEATS